MFLSSFIILSFFINSVVGKDPLTYCTAPLPQAHPFPLQGYEISQISVLVRHGDRSPVHLMVIGEDQYTWNCKNFETTVEYDLDGALKYKPQYKIVKNALTPALWHGTCGVGQLTERGFEQHHNLGKAFRDIYVNYFKFLPDVLSKPDMIYVRSTDLPRTRQSAMSHLAGLWDSNHRSSATRTIEIDVYPNILDTLQQSEGFCPRLQKLIQAQKSTKKWQDYLASVKKTIVKMNSITGCDFDALYRHSDILHPIVCHNMSLPCRNGACVTSEDVQIVHDGADFEMTYQYADDEIARLAVGIFVSELQAMMLNGTFNNGPIYALFAAHDFTIAQMFQALHLGIAIWPPYASHMTFEMWKKSGTNHAAVRLLYNGEVMKIPGCTLGDGTVCSDDEFASIVNRLKVESYDACLS